MSSDDSGLVGLVLIVGAAVGISKTVRAISRKMSARSAESARQEQLRLQQIAREKVEEERQERRARLLPVIEAAEAAGFDVCKDCLTIEPSRCSYDGACTEGCSRCCPSDD